jgi:hypothetical protein
MLRDVEFQPFLRFWLRRDHEGPHPYDGGVGVSTLLEILGRAPRMHRGGMIGFNPS